MQDPKKKKPYRKAMRANHRTTADASWYRIKKFIKEKAEEYGKDVREVDRFFPSSQICHHCGHVNRFTKNCNIVTFRCEGCGALLHRDVNAAINIRERALNPQYMQQQWDDHRKELRKKRVKRKASKQGVESS